MRSNRYINHLFANGGPFIGANRSNAIVTVEKDWFLTEADVSGRYFENGGNEMHVKRRNPVRWFQRANNSQDETIIPNVKKISIDRNLGQDAAGCDITILNTRMKSNNGSMINAKTGDFGDPGFLTFNHGYSQAARDRWGYSTNEWHRVLQPGALLRTYQGYGGHGLTLDEALDAGNLMQTGTWIVDSVSLDSKGGMSIKCRDVMALLIDQLIYPPLVPHACYPPGFYNFGENNFNFKDISSVVALICLWAGFWLKDSKKRPIVYGNIEQTGFTPDSPIAPDFFDKRTCIDVINELKKVVGYIVWVDQEGAFHFESKNVWEKGNFYYTGQHTDNIITLDEKFNLMDYDVTTTKSSDRSDIYVSGVNPQLNLPGTKYARQKWLPAEPGEAWGTFLRGMTVPMMLGVKIDMAESQMNIMAQIIHLYLWFARRNGRAKIPANPCIDINDQVRIMERTTGESFYHYVNGVRSEHDLETGVYTMDLDTNWLGSNENWAIVADGKWNIKYSAGESMAVSPDAYGPYREGKMVRRRD